MNDSLLYRCLAALGMVGLSCTIIPLVWASSFDGTKPGSLPRGWECGSTGGGSPRWIVQPETSAAINHLVLKQTGRGKYPWCVRSDSSLVDGWVQVRFKAVSGKEDQAGGVVWRWKDSDNYYVARANALENNVSLYYTKGGTRSTIKYTDAPVPANTWHVLRVEYKGTHIRVSLNGKVYIEEEDQRISGPGKVGVWTKADSVTLFDDFAYEASRN